MRFVLEAKARKLGLKAILDELDQAIENRDALAGIAVFRTQEIAPTSAPFHIFGNKAIAVLDKDADDTAALRVAYMWARWVAQRESAAGPSSEIDSERITSAVDEAVRALATETTIKKSHTQARKAIDSASSQVAQLRLEVERALAKVADALHVDE